MFVVTESGISAEGRQQISILRALVQDLERIQAGRGPTEADLANAPLLKNYFMAQRKVPVLQGYVFDHPRIGSTPAITSTVWAIARGLGWARTQNRFYRLNNPMLDSEL